MQEFLRKKEITAVACQVKAIISFDLRAPLNILRTESGEKIFRQMKQNSARVVHPTRRNFVKYHEKDSVDSRREEFLEVPLTCFYFFTRIPSPRSSSSTKWGRSQRELLGAW